MQAIGTNLNELEDDDTTATPEFTYYRFEPIISPVLALRKEISHDTNPSESLRHIVIRSFNSTEDGDLSPTEDSAERHIAPPKISQLIAELHGMFDGRYKNIMTTDNNNRKKSNFNLIANKDVGSLEVYPPIGNEANEHYPVARSEKLVLPYLPDPLSYGASLWNLPGVENGNTSTNSNNVIMVGEINELQNGEHSITYSPISSENLTDIQANSVTKIGFGKPEDWPDMLPFRIIVVEPRESNDNLNPNWDPVKRVLTVKLQKAERSKIKLSSYLKREDDLANIGVWNWYQNPDRTDYKIHVLNGLHTIITPAIDITLVHAVQKPISFIKTSEGLKMVPEITKLDIVNESDQSGTTSLVRLKGEILVHRKSTSKVDLEATWSEPLDDGINEKPDKDGVNYVALTKEYILPYGGDDIHPFEDDQHFADAKHRLVSYKVIARSRFSDYFQIPSEIEADKKATFFTRESKKSVKIHIPNRRKPKALEIAYAIPIHRWKEERNNDGQNSTHIISQRISAGLRVYLKRKWWDTGDKELLGVMLLNKNSLQQDESITDEKFRKYVSIWGTDPLWPSVPLSTPSPSVKDFIAVAQLKDDTNTSSIPAIQGDIVLPNIPKVMKTIQSEDEGEAVSALQTCLNSSDCPPSGHAILTVDGKFGPATKDRVKEFQANRGLVSDGIVSPNTWNELCNFCPGLCQYHFTVIGHEVNYDPQKDLWYSDIEINNDKIKEAYFPFCTFIAGKISTIFHSW